MMNAEDQDVFDAMNAKYYTVFGVCSISLAASLYIMYKIIKKPAESTNYRSYMWMTALANFYGGYQMLRSQQVQQRLIDKYLENVSNEGLKALAKG